jgi:hypothetical protein
MQPAARRGRGERRGRRPTGRLTRDCLGWVGVMWMRVYERACVRIWGVCVDVADAVKRCAGEGYAVSGARERGMGALGYGLGTCGRSPCVQCFCQLLCGVLVWVCRS